MTDPASNRKERWRWIQETPDTHPWASTYMCSRMHGPKCTHRHTYLFHTRCENETGREKCKTKTLDQPQWQEQTFTGLRGEPSRSCGTASEGAGERAVQSLRAIFVSGGRGWGGHDFNCLETVGWELNQTACFCNLQASGGVAGVSYSVGIP